MFSGHSSSDTKSGYSLSDDALRALQSGDTQALIDSHREARGLRMEADDDGDDDDDDTSGGDDNNSKDSGDSGSGDDSGDDDDDSSGDDDDADTKAAIARMEKRMKAADQRAAKAEKELKKIEDSKKDKVTIAEERVTELETEVKDKDATIGGLRLQIGFLSTNKHSWHKPGAALKLAQSEGYLNEVTSDDGEVDSKKLGSALDKLAKEHAYLVKTGGGSGSSGESGGGRSGNGKDDKAIKEADRRRAPALSRQR